MSEVEFDEGEDIREAPEAVELVAEAEETPEVVPVPPKIEFSPEQQLKFNDEIGKKVGQTHAEKRRADDLQAQLDAIKSKLPEETRPTVPEAPDPYSATYQQDLQAYTQAVTEQANYDSSERQKSESALQNQQETQRKQNEDANKAIGDYAGRATKLGIKAEDLQKAGEKLMTHNISNEAAAYILDEPIGPQITIYLAQNPAIAEEVANLSPIKLGERMAEIKVLAAGQKPKIELAPDPANLLGGKGAAEGDKGPPGVKYE